MKRCGRCEVDFAGDLDLCPLCQAPLKGEATPSAFPRNEMRRSGTMALRVLVFGTEVGVLAMVFAGFAFTSRRKGNPTSQPAPQPAARRSSTAHSPQGEARRTGGAKDRAHTTVTETDQSR